MNIVKYPVRTYREHCMCECGGEYVLNSDSDKMFTSVLFSEGYSHICNKCGKEIVLEKIYPNIVQYEVQNND